MPTNHGPQALSRRDAMVVKRRGGAGCDDLADRCVRRLGHIGEAREDKCPSRARGAHHARGPQDVHVLWPSCMVRTSRGYFFALLANFPRTQNASWESIPMSMLPLRTFPCLSRARANLFPAAGTAKM